MIKKIGVIFLASIIAVTMVHAATVAQVTGVTVTDTTTNTATITWDAVSGGVDFYKVRLLNADGTKIKAKKVTEETKTFKKLSENTLYQVQVRAVVNDVKGEWSDAVEFTTDAATQNHDVSIQNLAFSDATITINVGDSVTWTNNDSMSHTVTSDTAAFDSGTISSSQTFALDFPTAGTYKYHCDFHPNMTGTVIVE